MDKLTQNLNYLRLLKRTLTRISKDTNVLKDSDFPNYFNDLFLNDLMQTKKQIAISGEVLWVYEGFCFGFSNNLNLLLMDFINSFRLFIDNSKSIYDKKEYWDKLKRTNEWLVLQEKANKLDLALSQYLDDLFAYLPERTLP